jgi:hypothetical protein
MNKKGPAAVVELAPEANIYDVQSIWAGSVINIGLLRILNKTRI